MSRSSRVISKEQLDYQTFLKDKLRENNVPCLESEKWLYKNYPDWRERVDSEYTWTCLGIDGVNYYGTFICRETPRSGRSA